MNGMVMQVKATSFMGCRNTMISLVSQISYLN